MAGRKNSGLGSSCHGWAIRLRRDDPELAWVIASSSFFLPSWLPYLQVLINFNEESRNPGGKTDSLAALSLY
jgi:hypothetical protein